MKGCGCVLSNEVYSALLNQLMNGELVPGQMINRRDIAESLGTSTAPVLEAMKQLEFDGYLETIPRRGTQVKPITKEDLIGNYIARIGFECMAVRMCITNGGLKERADVLRELAHREEAVRKEYGPSFEAWTADSEYHLALVESCGNARLFDEYRRIALPNLFYRQHHVTRDHPSRFPDDHLKLTEDLVGETSPDAAEKRIRAHIASGISMITSLLGD